MLPLERQGLGRHGYGIINESCVFPDTKKGVDR